MPAIFTNISPIFVSSPIFPYFRLIKTIDQETICNDGSNFDNLVEFARRYHLSIPYEYFNNGDVEIAEILEMSEIRYERLNERMYRIPKNIKLDEILELWFRERFRIPDFPSYDIIREAKLRGNYKLIDSKYGAYFEKGCFDRVENKNVIIETSVFYFKYIEIILEELPVEVIQDNYKFAIIRYSEIDNEISFGRTMIFNIKNEFINFPPKRFRSRYEFKNLANDDFIFKLESLEFSLESARGRPEFIGNYEI